MLITKALKENYFMSATSAANSKPASSSGFDPSKAMGEGIDAMKKKSGESWWWALFILVAVGGLLATIITTASLSGSLSDYTSINYFMTSPAGLMKPLIFYGLIFGGAYFFCHSLEANAERELLAGTAKEKSFSHKLFNGMKNIDGATCSLKKVILIALLFIAVFGMLSANMDQLHATQQYNAHLAPGSVVHFPNVSLLCFGRSAVFEGYAMMLIYAGLESSEGSASDARFHFEEKERLLHQIKAKELESNNPTPPASSSEAD